MALTPVCLACAEGLTVELWCKRHKGEELGKRCIPIPVPTYNPSPFPAPTDPVCCLAFTPSCLACAENLSEELWCIKHMGDKQGQLCTPTLQPTPLVTITLPSATFQQVCCMAFTPSCLACAEGLSVEQWCITHNDDNLGNLCRLSSAVTSIPPIAPERVCCTAFTPSCLSCVEGLSEVQWCMKHRLDEQGKMCVASSNFPSQTSIISSSPPVKYCCMALTSYCLACVEGISEFQWCLKHKDDLQGRLCLKSYEY